MSKVRKIPLNSKRGTNSKMQKVTHKKRKVAILKKSSAMKAKTNKNIERSALIRKYLNTQDFDKNGISKKFTPQELSFLKKVKITIRNKKNTQILMRNLHLTSEDIAALRKKMKKLEKPDPVKQYGENDGSGLSSDKVLKAIHALLQLLERQSNKEASKPLFEENKDIFLHITTMKSPRTPARQIRIALPHSLLPDSPDVCLFTSDLKKGRREDHEPTVQHFKDLLKQKGVTRISEVITLRQLKTEYEQYEMKRALCNRFDMFLSEAKVCGHIAHLLGKTFYDRKKLPVPIQLDQENLNEQLERALRKTAFRIHRSGQVFVLKVAHSLLTPEQICDNIMAVAVYLTEHFPYGWDNVQNLLIKGAKTIPVPIYYSTFSSANVKRSNVTRRPKAYKKVLGDIPGVGIVGVHANGFIEIEEEEQMDELEMDLHAEDSKRGGKRFKIMSRVQEAQKEHHQIQTDEAENLKPKSSDECDKLSECEEDKEDGGQMSLNHLETAYLKNWVHTKGVEKENSRGKSKKLRK